MSGYYYYLISSLPMLHFGGRPPFSFEKFIEYCRGQLPGNETRLLHLTLQVPENFDETTQSTLKKWYVFEISLRNELARIRAGSKKIDPNRYVRPAGYTEPAIYHLALNAHRRPSVLEAEKMLDEARWRFLDELTAGHYFDIDYLIVYALKLLISERWEKIRIADKPGLIETVAAEQTPSF